jgi:hypothetical protein
MGKEEKQTDATLLNQNEGNPEGGQCRQTNNDGGGGEHL